MLLAHISTCIDKLHSVREKEVIKNGFRPCIECCAVYNWFTEGFDTADLNEAKALLELGRAPRSGCQARRAEVWIKLGARDGSGP